MKLNFKTHREIFDFLKNLDLIVDCGFDGFTVNGNIFLRGSVQEMEARIISLVLRNKI